MDRSELLTVVTPVSRPELLATISATLPPGAEWVVVTDGPRAMPAGLRSHVLIEGPATGQWGDVQRQLGLLAASREFVTFLDDDNVMLPMLAELVVPALQASGHGGALFGLLLQHAGGYYSWPPPQRVERSQVDTAMFLGRTDAARRVGWPDLSSGDWPGLEGKRCGDFAFLRAFDEQERLLRLPLIAGFHDGVRLLRYAEPELLAALERGEDAGDRLLDVLHRSMRQADAPPWWKGEQALVARTASEAVAAELAPVEPAAAEPAPVKPIGAPAPALAPRPVAPAREAASPLIEALSRLAGDEGEGSSVLAQRVHFAELARRRAADRPGQPLNVLEIGFNVGLGSAAFLEATPQTAVVSFDLGEHPYVVECAAHLRERFPHRLHLVFGDSRQTVPRVGAELGARFDLILIDGGHDEPICRADVLNTRALAAPGALVIVDDLMPHKGYGAGVVHAWDKLLAEGVLVAPEMWCALPGAARPEADAGQRPERCERRWGVARFGSAR